MKKSNSEFDLGRMRSYMALPAEIKLKYLQEVNNFFSRFRNKKTNKIQQKLKALGF